MVVGRRNRQELRATDAWCHSPVAATTRPGDPGEFKQNLERHFLGPGQPARIRSEIQHERKETMMNIPATMRALQQTSLAGPGDLRLVHDAPVPNLRELPKARCVPKPKWSQRSDEGDQLRDLILACLQAHQVRSSVELKPDERLTSRQKRERMESVGARTTPWRPSIRMSSLNLRLNRYLTLGKSPCAWIPPGDSSRPITQWSTTPQKRPRSTPHLE